MIAANEVLKGQRVPWLPRPSKRRWLLWLATRCYFAFLRANGWKRQLLPSPLKGGGLILKWQKVIDGRRYVLTTEEALSSESNLHRAWSRRKAEAEANQ